MICQAGVTRLWQEVYEVLSPYFLASKLFNDSILPRLGRSFANLESVVDVGAIGGT